jgi:hypothetical protein
MRLALSEERKDREQLLSELEKTRATAGQQQAQLTEREKQVQTFQQQLQAREEQSLKLQESQTNLQHEFALAQGNIQTLNQQLQTTSKEATLSKEKLAALEAEARKQAEQAALFKKQMDLLSQSNQVVLAEKQQLSTKLQVAEAEKRAATEQTVLMQEQVKVERAEKAKLAEGVTALASKSGELTKEIRENRPLAPNTIFTEFVTNRVQAQFLGVRPGFFGNDATRERETGTVLVSDGTNTFALCHVQDTPFTLATPSTDWEGLAGTLLGRSMALLPIHALSFAQADPRVIFMPITAAEAAKLGAKVYRISPTPFKFQDAVVIGARESYYGESKFQVDVTTPEYLKMDHSSLKGLFGKFNPSRRDLVFSKTGELLGIMANSTYCLMLQDFKTSASFQFGKDVRNQHTGDTLSRLSSVVLAMPPKLQ